MKIRTKISVYFAPFIIIAVLVIYLLNYAVIRRELVHNAHLELAKVEQNMHCAAQSLLRAAITNYLRGITDKNLDYIQLQYDAFLRGAVTEQEAKNNIQNYFNHQIVGTSGYLAAVEEKENRFFLDLHPFLPREDCTETEGCRAWAETRNGYTEYDWKNPTDNSSRKKAAFVREFPPWNWVVGASSYRDEFVNLINVEDLREMLSPIRINKSGYFIVFNEDKELLIHPVAQNVGRKGIVNTRGEDISKRLMESEDGYLTYYWKNPDDERERLKYGFVEKLEDFNWYLVATGYLSEVYEPIEYLRKLTVLIIVFACLALFTIIYRVSETISRPLRMLEDGIKNFYTTKTPFKWQKNRVREIDVLGNAFARMTDELNLSLLDLEEKNRELASSEHEIEKNRMFLDSIIDSMPSVIIGVDPQLAVNQWNSKAERATGLSRKEVQGRILYDVYEGLEPHGEAISQSLQDRQVITLPLSKEEEERGAKYSEITVYPLVTTGSGGAVIRIDEVTDRVEMEQRLMQSQKMDAVSQLAGGIAHDFNNMLGGIVGAAELLRMKAAPDEQKLVKIISDASARASELIQKLLAFSRKGDVSLAAVDMHSIITNTIEILEHTLDKKVTITSDLKAEMSMVMGERSQLQNSLLNIGINGGHAMPDGGELFFRTQNVNLDEMYCNGSPFELTPGQYLQISIRDTGQSISQGNLKRIFEPFFTTREQDKGTGLGLAAVYGAVQQHHGAVRVNSELGEGAEFVLELPLSSTDRVQHEKSQRVVMGTGNILIVDDEPVVRMTAKLMLEKLGYTVLEAENGREGIEMYERHQQTVQLVLLDMLMPVMDGTECFQRLKELDPEVKVVISSGFTRDADLHLLKEQGLCDFVRKPLNMAELSETVANVLNASAG